MLTDRAPDGRGYWLTAKDGGIFSFGDAQFYGSLGGQSQPEPVVGIASPTKETGYWLVTIDGGVISFNPSTVPAPPPTSNPGNVAPSPIPAPTTGTTPPSPDGDPTPYVIYTGDSVSSLTPCVNLGNGQVVLDYSIGIESSPEVSNINYNNAYLPLEAPDTPGMWQAGSFSAGTVATGYMQWAENFYAPITFTFPAGQPSYTIDQAHEPLVLVVGGKTYDVNYAPMTISGSSCS